MKDKLSKRELLTFASGDLFGGGAQIIINFYFLVFLTDVVKIRPILAGIIILVSEIWDAISDPLMGILTDRTRTRWGRRRPYFLAGFFGILAAFFMIWYPISNDSEMVRFFYMLFAYTLYTTVSTIVMVPYSAMSSEISTDYQERTKVNGMRLVFSQASSLICAVVPIEIVKAFANQNTGYMVMALAFAFFFAIPFLLIFLFTKERVPMEEKSESRAKIKLDDVIKPLKVRSFRSLILIYLSAFLAMDIVSVIFAYYMNYYLIRPTELNYVLGALLITQLILVPAVIKASYKIEKSGVVRYSVVIWLGAILLMSLLQPDWPAWAIYLNAVFMGFGIVGCVVMPWVMFPDVTDIGELAFGSRNAGSFSGIMTLTRKSSSALGMFIVSTILEFAGYIEPETIMENGVTKTIYMEQPDSFMLAIKIIILVIPFILLLFTWFQAKRYPLNRAASEKVTQYLEYQRRRTDVNPISQEELEEIKESVI